jgi:S1-C subfamily serine protease
VWVVKKINLEMNSQVISESDSDESSVSEEEQSVESRVVSPSVTGGVGEFKSVGEIIMQRSCNSVLKIEVESKEYNHRQPWSAPSITKSSGSGFVVMHEGRLCVVTNAHVVNGAVELSVRKAFGKKKYRTKVIAVGHQCDLAMLELPSALQSKVKPVEMVAAWLNVGERVYVMGFPQMGEEICITDGVIARRELDEYMHSSWYGLQYGVSAAINPGNSGGSAFNARGSLVGVPFQGADNSQGFIIPVEVLQHFLADCAAKRQPAFPDLGLTWQTMENRRLRQRYKIPKKTSGVLINKVPPLSSAQSLIVPGDVILSVSGYKVSNEGRVKIKGSWVDFEYLLSTRFLGDSVNFSLLRNGAVQHVQVPLLHTAEALDAVKWQYETPATYVIISGVVLKVLALNDITSIDEDDERKCKGSQVVVLHQVLASRVTRGYEDYKDEQIKQVNGVEIKNIDEAIDAMANSADEFITFKIKSGQEIVVGNIKNNDKALLHHLHILKQYDIVKMCSDDLLTALQLCGIKRDVPAAESTVVVDTLSVDTQLSVDLGGANNHHDDMSMSEYELDDVSDSSATDDEEESKCEEKLLSASPFGLLKQPPPKRQRVSFVDDVVDKENCDPRH